MCIRDRAAPCPLLSRLDLSRLLQRPFCDTRAQKRIDQRAAQHHGAHDLGILRYDLLRHHGKANGNARLRYERRAKPAAHIVVDVYKRQLLR